VCGTDRQQDNGLRIFPGPIENSSTIAALWLPTASLAGESGVIKTEILWSTLDCTGALTLVAPPKGVTTVLGEFTVSIVDTVKVGEQCVVIGWPLGSDSRKHLAGTAIYAPHSRLVVLSRAVWLAGGIRKHLELEQGAIASIRTKTSKAAPPK